MSLEKSPDLVTPLLAVARRSAKGFAASCTIAIMSAQAETEPSHYIYQGKPKPLSLDSHYIAVHVQTPSAADLPAVLSSRGFTSADVETRPLPQWLLLHTRNALAVPRKNTQPGNTSSVQTDAAMVHGLISSLLAAGDPNLNFVSPVFKDDTGNLVVVTSRILIGFEKDFTPAERVELQTGVP